MPRRAVLGLAAHSPGFLVLRIRSGMCDFECDTRYVSGKRQHRGRDETKSKKSRLLEASSGCEFHGQSPFVTLQADIARKTRKLLCTHSDLAPVRVNLSVFQIDYGWCSSSEMPRCLCGEARRDRIKRWRARALLPQEIAMQGELVRKVSRGPMKLSVVTEMSGRIYLGRQDQ